MLELSNRNSSDSYSLEFKFWMVVFPSMTTLDPEAYIKVPSIFSKVQLKARMKDLLTMDILKNWLDF